MLESPTAAKCEILYEHSNYFDASKWTVKGEICGAGGIKYSGLERAQGEVMTYEWRKSANSRPTRVIPNSPTGARPGIRSRAGVPRIASNTTAGHVGKLSIQVL